MNESIYNQLKAICVLMNRDITYTQHEITRTYDYYSFYCDNFTMFNIDHKPIEHMIIINSYHYLEEFEVRSQHEELYSYVLLYDENMSNVLRKNAKYILSFDLVTIHYTD